MNFFFELDDDDLQFLETETIPVKAVTTLFKRKRNDLEEGEIEEFPSKKQNDMEEGEIEDFSTPKTRICNDSYYFDKILMKRAKLYI